MRKKLSLDHLMNKSKALDLKPDHGIDVLEERKKILEEFRNKQISSKTISSDPLLVHQSPSGESSYYPNINQGNIIKTSKIAPSDVDKIQKQKDNNKETTVYVNKIDYVNNEETINTNSSDIVNKFVKYENNTKTDVYVNKIDYVNNGETKTRRDIVEKNNICNSEGLSSDNTKTFDYVNNSQTKDKQYLNNTETVQPEDVNNSQTIQKHSVNYYDQNTTTNAVTIDKQVNPSDLIFSLPRSEEKILNFLISLCLNTASLITPKITYRKISESTQITEKSCKTLIGRLKNKKIIFLVKYTKGPGSFSVYSIPQEIYNSYLHLASKSLNFDIFNLNGNRAETQLTSNKETNPASKLVSNLNNTNNTKKIFDFNVNDLNIENLRLLGISSKAVGDALRNLTKYLESNEQVTPLTKEEFQDFIDKFVEYANSSHGKTMNSKHAIFIGEIQRFQKNGSCSTMDWHSDKEYEIYQKFVKEETKRRQKNLEIENQARGIAFLKWKENKKEEDLLKLIPEGSNRIYAKFGKNGNEQLLWDYYCNNIWEDEKNNLLNEQKINI